MDSDIEVLEPSVLVYERGKENEVSSSKKRQKMDLVVPPPAPSVKATPSGSAPSKKSEFGKKMKKKDEEYLHLYHWGKQHRVTIASTVFVARRESSSNQLRRFGMEIGNPSIL